MPFPACPLGYDFPPAISDSDTSVLSPAPSDNHLHRPHQAVPS